MKMEIVKEIISTVLNKYPKARKIAVENFLMSSVGYEYNKQLMNLEYDAYLYHWKTDTVKAIRSGLSMMKKAGLLK